MSLQDEVERRATDSELPCAVAFEIAAACDTTPASLSEAADGCKVRISKCQLGLFGYQAFGTKRIAGRLDTVPEALLQALNRARVHGSVPCAAAWKIADEARLPRLLVGAAANTLDLRIAPCQLGCF
ncbi:hypothetical protein ACFLSF_03490 [Candidatus Bipolaricaulota bacterium]